MLKSLLALLLATACLHAADPRPGVALTLTGSGKTDTRSSRLVALHIPAGQPASPFISAGAFEARWEGDLVSPLRARVNFHLYACGEARLTLNGKELLAAGGDAPDVPLNKGANRLVVEYRSPPQGDASLQLWWSGRDFPPEPVPPGVLVHSPVADLVRAGRLLFAQNRCTACHEGTGLVPPREEGRGMPEMLHDAPALGEYGARFNEPWLAHWINNPHAIRPESLMPRVFTGPDDKVDPRAADLAAYLVTLGTRNDAKPLDENVPVGAALFANLGCVACHSTPDAQGEDEHRRVPLGHLRAKWQAPALREYLKDPQKNYAWTRMPNFHLSDEEAERLTAYLLAGEQREYAAGPAGDAGRGAQLLVSSNCLNCHAGMPPMTTPKLTATVAKGWTAGCMAPDAAARGAAPDFAFTPVQREALVAFAAAGFGSLGQDAPVEFAHRQFENLRCAACHAIDGQPSTWSQLEGEMAVLQAGAPVLEGEGVPVAGTVVPHFTWLGEKLQPDWMAGFIAGTIKDKPRPWLLARMPAFPTHAAGLAHGMAQAHGFPGTREAHPAGDPEFVKAGETLIGENGGFNCTTCHGVGERPATAVFEAPGINLALSADRVRRGYYQRWVLHPLRVDPETKMPRFSDDEGKTALADFFGGDARSQFEAIRQWVWSTRPQHAPR